MKYIGVMAGRGGERVFPLSSIHVTSTSANFIPFPHLSHFAAKLKLALPFLVALLGSPLFRHWQTHNSWKGPPPLQSLYPPPSPFPLSGTFPFVNYWNCAVFAIDLSDWAAVAIGLHRFCFGFAAIAGSRDSGSDSMSVVAANQSIREIVKISQEYQYFPFFLLRLLGKPNERLYRATTDRAKGYLWQRLTLAVTTKSIYSNKRCIFKISLEKKKKNSKLSYAFWGCSY